MTISKKTTGVAQFISERIDELRPRFSQTEISTTAGFPSPNMLSMIKDGKAKLPMDRVLGLAQALSCDVTTLTRLALQQFYDQPVLDLIFKAGGDPAREAEVSAYAIALGVEVRIAAQDVKFAKQYASNSVSRAEALDDRLKRIQRGLDELLVAARTAGKTFSGI